MAKTRELKTATQTARHARMHASPGQSCNVRLLTGREHRTRRPLTLSSTQSLIPRYFASDSLSTPALKDDYRGGQDASSCYYCIYKCILYFAQELRVSPLHLVTPNPASDPMLASRISEPHVFRNSDVSEEPSGMPSSLVTPAVVGGFFLRLRLSGVGI